MISWSTEYKVRYYDTDKMGHVHHGAYLRWFEDARIDMLDAIGLPYVELEESGIMLPVVEVRLRYRKPAYFGDMVKVMVSMEGEVRSKLEVGYVVGRGEEVLAEGEVVLVFVDGRGKPVRAPRDFLEILRRVGEKA